jgi:hypothetical protein
MAQDEEEENASATLAVQEADEPLSTPPKPGPDPLIMSL